MSQKGQTDTGFLQALSVLYVEDEAEVRTELARFLRRRFAHVETAEDGRHGLDQFRAGSYDVVVTDVKMPGLDGLEMARAIKAARPDMPIIVVTAYNETDYFMRAIEIGIDQYVKKPVNPDLLVDAVHKATELRFKQRELEETRRELLDLLSHTVEVLSRAIEKRDPYTDGHQKRVAKLAVAMGEKLGLAEPALTNLRLAALIHDVGKIYVPAEVLSRPGRLSAVEYELVKTHAVVGAEIVGDLKTDRPLAEIVRQHHERLDGSGYPDGLAGERICMEARIIAVADVVDAMCSHRPYRPALDVKSAINELTDHRGILYDPRVVDVCLEVLREPALAALRARS